MSEQGLNSVTLIGRVAADGELRYTQSNQPVLNFRLATSDNYFDKNSKERKETCEWHSITLWGKRGEALSKILTKGSRICVQGKLQTRSWEKDGEKRYKTEIVGLNVILLGGGPGERGNGTRDDAGSSSTGTGGGGGDDRGYESSHEPTDDDIPFSTNVLHSYSESIGERWNRSNQRLI